MQSTIWIGVDPRPPQVRLLATGPDGQTLLKARLPRHPHHPRALVGLAESLALWLGRPARCALSVGEAEPWCDMGIYGLHGDERDHGLLCRLEAVTSLEKARRMVRPRDLITGMGDFRDLRQLELFMGGGR
jgi:hypothetical protein